MGSVLSKPKLKLILTSIIRSKTNESTQVLSAPIPNIFLEFFFLKKSEGLSTELFRQSNCAYIDFNFLISCVNLALDRSLMEGVRLLYIFNDAYNKVVLL